MERCDEERWEDDVGGEEWRAKTKAVTLSAIRSTNASSSNRGEERTCVMGAWVDANSAAAAVRRVSEVRKFTSTSRAFRWAASKDGGSASRTFSRNVGSNASMKASFAMSSMMSQVAVG